MAEVEASVRDLVNGDCDGTERALAQIDLRRKINLLIDEWKAAGAVTSCLTSAARCVFAP